MLGVTNKAIAIGIATIAGAYLAERGLSVFKTLLRPRVGLGELDASSPRYERSITGQCYDNCEGWPVDAALCSGGSAETLGSACPDWANANQAEEEKA